MLLNIITNLQAKRLIIKLTMPKTIVIKIKVNVIIRNLCLWLLGKEFYHHIPMSAIVICSLKTLIRCVDKFVRSRFEFCDRYIQIIFMQYLFTSTCIVYIIWMECQKMVSFNIIRSERVGFFYLEQKYKRE